uniref:VWFA domain-containing protein n=1 Tax=Leersia perrieri TaxID=77586 RepID=A0A0D9XS09_9ORYZ
MGLQLITPNLLACLFYALLFAQVTSVTEGTEVKVSTTPVFPMIPRNQAHKDFQMLLRVEAPTAADLNVRFSIDLVVVVDVGEGENLNLVKKAMKFAIRQLNDKDSLTVVSTINNPEELKNFSTHIGGRRRIAEKKVDQLRGRDNAHRTWEETLKMLNSQPESSLDGRERFIMLVTDNNSSRYNVTEMLLMNFQYSVHTFGLGTAHDPSVLQLIAARSMGTYSFLDDDNLHKLDGALALCLGGLTSVVTTVGTRVMLDAAIDGGAKITKIDSGGYPSYIYENTSGEIIIRALYAGEVRNFIVHLNVPAAKPDFVADTGVCRNQQLLLIANLVGPNIEAGSIQDLLIVQRPKTTVLPIVPYPIVVNQIFQFQVLEMVDIFIAEEIKETKDEKDDDEETKDDKDDNNEETKDKEEEEEEDNDEEKSRSKRKRKLGNKLKRKMDKLVMEHKFSIGLNLGVGGLPSVISTVALVLTAVGSVATSAIALSLLSSLMMQRPTAMGSPNLVIDAFLTMEMRLKQQMAIKVNGTAECDYSCIDPVPPSLFVLGEDNTYHFNSEAYQGILSTDEINQMMSKLYQENAPKNIFIQKKEQKRSAMLRSRKGLVKANSLNQCPATPTSDEQQPEQQQ